MADDPTLLVFTAALVGVVHTLVGPDHYLPFIALSRARKWSLGRTAGVTLFCGLGHVLGSLILGAVAIALGVTVSRLEAVDSQRGELAAWILIASGLVYLAWGLRRATGHGHSHSAPNPGSLTPWMLFLVFVLGPCEPLIPVLLYPAASGNPLTAAVVVAVFAAVTLATMLAAVLVGTVGMGQLRLAGFERYGDAFAGGVITLCGAGILFLGW